MQRWYSSAVRHVTPKPPGGIPPALSLADRDDDVASKCSADAHQFVETTASRLTVVMQRQADNGRCKFKWIYTSTPSYAFMA
jgi:hypothetical protein